MNPVRNNFDGGTPEEETLSHTNERVQASPTAVNKKPRYDYSWIIYAIAAIGIALLIRFFVAAPYVVSGSSMEPTFYDWHYLIVDRITYDFEKPQRGDIIVLNSPQVEGRALIKRVIGLPGDTVVLSGPDPTVTIIDAAYPKGFTLSEPYIDPANYGGATDMKVTLGPDQYFVMGDNRVVSLDSRYIGPIPGNDIVGRVFVRLYPFNEIGIFPGEVRYANPSTS